MTFRSSYQIHGLTFPPGSSKPYEAHLHLNASETLVWVETCDGTLKSGHHPNETIKVEPNMGTREMRVSLPDGWLFLTSDPRVDTYFPTGDFARMRAKYEAFSPRLIFVVASCVLGVIALWKFAIPLLANIAVHMTPNAAIQAIDAGTMRSLDMTIAAPSTLNDQQKEPFLDIFDALIAEIPSGPETQYALEFRDIAGVGPNAFALPGGTMVLTDELIRKYGNDRDLVAGVIGHELGHVTHQHGLNLLYRSLSIYVIFALFAGDVGPILDEVMLEGQTSLSLVYSKRYETDADIFALDLMGKSNFDPHGLRRFFEDIQKYDLKNDWFSTHPLSSERIKAIDAYLLRAQ